MGPVVVGMLVLAVVGCAVWRWAVRGQEKSRPAGGEKKTAAGRAVVAPDPELFKPLPSPGPHDWLAGPGRNEPEQSFEQYVGSSPVRPTAERNVIVLQPLGEFGRSETALLEQVRTYGAIFFGLDVRIEKARPLPQRGVRARTDGPKPFRQYLTGAIMDEVLRPNLPRDALCYLGITLADLYPEPSWNFVFGQASLRDRVGVYSFARHRPEFYGQQPDKHTSKLILMRSVKVMVHETGHMFGLHHCHRYECVVNGSNHLAESDARPVFLCPDCLRKLHWNLNLDIVARYEKMEEFWERQGFQNETRWLRQRLKKLRPPVAPAGDREEKGR